MLKFNKLVVHAQIPDTTKNKIPLVAIDYAEIGDYGYMEYGTGLSVTLADNQIAFLLPASDIERSNLRLLNPNVTSDEEIVFIMEKRSDNENVEPQVGDVLGYLVVLNQ